MATYSQPQLKAMAASYATAAGVDPETFVKQIGAESGWNVAAKSPVGAEGIAQFMPATAAGFHIDPLDPKAALQAAAHYDSSLLKQFGGNQALMLAGYNAGGGNARKALGPNGFAETKNYVKEILGGTDPAIATSGAPAAAAAVASAPTATPSVTTTTGMTPQQQTALGLIFGDSQDANGQALESSLASKFAAQTTTVPGVSVPTPAAVPATPSSFNPAGLKGTATVDGKLVASWIAPELEYAMKHGWDGTVTSGYRTAAEQAALQGHSGGNPVAAVGQSNHEFTDFPGGAVDVSDAAALSKILASSPYAGKLVWAGGKDPVHFSHPHAGGY